MAFDPIATPLAIGGAAFQGFTSSAAASSRNSAIRDAQDAERQAAQATANQAAQRAAVEREQRRRRTEQIRGRIRVATAASGIGIGDTALSLQRQADFDSAFNEEIARQNLSNEITRIQSGAQYRIDALQNNVVNPLVEAFSGIFGGAQTGLRIAGAFAPLAQGPAPEPDPNPPPPPDLFPERRP